ncbi:MAG TPA: hypothetical protein VJ810_20285 [Blastocatellia bacterium]|nr:hypothetical protein [Blastocatellia bacterium]
MPTPHNYARTLTQSIRVKFASSHLIVFITCLVALTALAGTVITVASGSMGSVIGLARTESSVSALATESSQKKSVTPVRASKRGAPWINFQDGRDMKARYVVGGSADAGFANAEIERQLMEGQAQAASLASDDINLDGFPDLVCGYAGASGGLVTLHLGNPEAFGPKKEETIRGIIKGHYPDPFLSDATVLLTTEAPDFLATGDFDRDGRLDIITAARGGSSIHLLSGDEGHVFRSAKALPLPGQITTMVTGEINYVDGLKDVAVGIVGDQGPAVLVFSGSTGALSGKPVSYPLQAAATAMAIGRLDDDPATDLAVVSGGEIVIIHGQDRKPSGRYDEGFEEVFGRMDAVRLPFAVKTIAVSDFIWDRDSRMEMAVLSEDGAVQILRRGELDSRPISESEAREGRRLAAEAKEAKVSTRAIRRASKPMNWEVAEKTSISVTKAGDLAQPLLMGTLASGQKSYDLLVLNPASRQLHIAMKEDSRLGLVETSGASDRKAVTFDADAEPVAVLPIRLNVHGRPGIVVMRRGRIEPVLMMTAAMATFVVDSAADQDDVNTADGVCDSNPGAPVVCTLRAAVQQSNALAGADMITFAASLNGTPIQLNQSGDDNNANAGDLDINTDIAIVGNGAANTLIQGSNNASFASNMGDKIFGVNQDGLNPTLNASLSGLTVRFTRNDITVNPGFTQTGGAMDIFLTGAGAMPGPTTTVTNCTFDSNASLHSYGGAINVDSGSLTPPTTNVFRGTVQFTNTTISNNDTLTVSGADDPPTGGGVNLFADIHNVTFTGCTITANQTSALNTANGGGVNMRHSNGGLVTLTNTTVSNNIAGSDGGGIMLVFNQNLTMTGGSITGNTANGTGGDADGGGLFNGTNTLPSGDLTLMLSGVTISNNTATAGANARGGGLHNNANSPITFTNCVFSGNSSDTGAGIANVADTVTINGTTPTGSSITGNIAGVSGGGVATLAASALTNITNTTLSGNNGPTSGGAFFVSGGTLAASLNRIVNNISSSGSGIAQTGGAATVENNWWQCDGFPNATGCQTGAGTFDADPRLDLGLSALLAMIPLGGSTTLTADVTKNTNGASTNGGNAPLVFQGLNLTFAAGPKGTINAPLTVAIPVNGLVAKTFTANANSAACGAAMPAVTLDNGTQDTTVVIQCADIMVAKVGSPAPNVVAGTNLTYTVTLSNIGTLAAANVTLTDPTPANTTFVSATAPAGWVAVTPPVGGTGNVVFSKASVAAAEIAVFTIVVNVNASTASGTTITNSATGATTTVETTLANNTGMAMTNVITQADLSVTKSDSPATDVVAGANITYTINFANNGPSDAQMVTVTDPTPANTTFVSATAPAGWTATTPAVGGTGNVIFSRATAVAGLTATFTIVVNVNSATPQGTTITNTVTAASGTTDPNAANNTAMATTNVLAQADLAVTKADSPDPVLAGANITYTLNLTNNGPGAASNTTVTDAVPANTTFVSATAPAGWTATTPPVGGTGNVVFSKATVGSGETATFTIVVNVNSSVANGSIITNTVTAASATPDPNTANNTDTETTTVNTQADLAVTKADSPDPVLAGANITYTISLTNNGPSNAQTVTVTDAVPANTTFVSATAPAGWTATTPAVGGTGNVVFSRATFAAGATAMFTIVVKVNAGVANGSIITNTVTAASATADPNAANNTDTETTTVNAQADLAVIKSDSSDPFIAGANGTYTVDLTNNGPSDAQTVSLTDNVPTNTTFVSATAPAGWTSTTPPVGGTGAITFTRPTFASGGTASFTIVVKVNTNVANGAIISNTATVSSATTDPNPANNTDTELTTINTQADLAVTKSGVLTPVTGGTNITYTVNLKNNGPSDAANVTVTDPTPVNTTFVSATAPAGWTATTPAVGGTGNVVFTNPSVPNSAMVVFTIVVRINNSTPGGTTITNTATAASATTDPVAGNNSGTATNLVNLPPVISKAFDSPDIFLNQTTTMTISIQNPNVSFALTGVSFTDSLPAGLVVGTPNGLSNTCGGTVTATAGSGAVNLSGGTIPGASSCQVMVNVRGTTVGTKTNTTSNVTATGTGAGIQATATITVHQGSVTLTNPPGCLGPGGVVAVTASITNNSSSPKSVVYTASLPPQLAAISGSCTANTGACTVVNASTVTWTGTLAASQTVTINYQTQVGDGATTGTQLCVNSAVSFNGGAPATLQACTTVTCQAVGPGNPFPATSEVSDQKAGSVLIYNLFTSNAASPDTHDTRINLTNIDPSRSAIVKLFFVDGASCSTADSFICLTPNQTASFLASDLDPNTTGYLVAVAVDSQGCPINFNNLIGDAYVKLSTGHAANLGAEAVAAIAGGLPLCRQGSETAQLNFDGVSYNRIPRVLALDNIPSRGDGNDTILVLNRIGGNLMGTAATLTNLFGIFYNDTETGVSFTFSPGVCQFRSSVSNNFPRITPRFETFVPAGRSGWIKVFSNNDQGILGAAINFNPNAASDAGAFNQGHNLHKLTLTSSASYTIPVFPPNC